MNKGNLAFRSCIIITIKELWIIDGHDAFIDERKKLILDRFSFMLLKTSGG